LFAKLFSCLNVEIFSLRIFGLDSVKDIGKDMELSMNHFEHIITNNSKGKCLFQ
jgi:hypothetical protein